MRTGALDRLHLGRQRVPDRRARRRSCRCRALSRLRDCLRRSSARGWASAASSRGRSSARRARSSAPRTVTTTRCRRPARRCSIALTAAGAPGRRDRQDRGSVRRPRHHAARSTPRATTTAWTRSRRRWPRSTRGLIFANLVDFDTLYGHRNDVAGYAAQPRALRRAAGGAAAAAARRRPARRHRRSRQRSDDAEHRSLARVRAAAGRRARACAPASISARATTFADLGQTLAESSASARSRTARASWHATIADRDDRRIREATRSARARDPRAAGGQERRHARPPAPGARRRRPPGVSARSRSHHPLQGVPPAEAQDAGVLRADRRSLPHAPDAHARGLADRADASPRCCGCTRS